MSKFLGWLLDGLGLVAFIACALGWTFLIYLIVEGAVV